VNLALEAKKQSSVGSEKKSPDHSSCPAAETSPSLQHLTSEKEMDQFLKRSSEPGHE